MSNKIKILKFSTNWNNKLDCNSFTSLRLSNTWYQGQNIAIQFKEKWATGKIIDARSIKCSQVNLFIAKLDTGYNVSETLGILGKMYNFDPYTNDKMLNFLLVEKTSNWYSDKNFFIFDNSLNLDEK